MIWGYHYFWKHPYRWSISHVWKKENSSFPLFPNALGDMRDRFLKDISRLPSVINNEKLHQCHSQSLENVAPPAVTHVRWGWPLGCIIPKQEPNISNNNDNNDNNSLHQPDALRNVAGWYKLIGTDTVSWVLGCRNTMEKREKQKQPFQPGGVWLKQTLCLFPHVVSSVCECVSIKVSHV